MKNKPSLFLTSLSVLLCQAASVEAQQQPQPRFGYGSVPRGAYVIPAPKTVPRPVVAAKPKAAAPKPTTAKTPSKPTSKAAPKPAAKPAPKTEVAKSTKKPAPKPAPVKEIASTKSKTKAKPAPEPKPTPKSSKTEVAKTSTRSSSKTAPKPAPTREREREVATTRSTKTPAASSRPTKPTAPAAVAKSTPVRKDSTPTSTRQNPNAALADVKTAPAQPTKGMHFFGVPVQVPTIQDTTFTSNSSAKAAPANDRNSFVDVLAARHSLTNGRLSDQRAKAADAAPALPAASAAPEAPAPVPSVTSVTPDALETPVLTADLDSLPASNPETILLDEPAAARSVPASLQMGSSLSAADTSLESTTLEEPALPTHVIARVSPATVTEEPLSLDAEPPLPSENPPPSAIVPEPEPAPAKPAKSGKASALAAAATALTEEHDLSERERAFVRSLAEAAGTVTTASGQMNKDLPRSIATAATSLVDQIPAETVNSFRAAASTARETVQDTVQDLVPDLPMEMSNDLMPTTGEKMPDRLPTFNAASSGKIDVQSDRQADYDQANNKVIFTGKVELNSAAIRLRAERVEVFMKKGGGGMERVEATGNVLMRTQDTENGPGQMASAGRASYNLKTGEITLSDWPKIQEAGKSHISTDPSTKMYMFTDGRLRTDGPNRTLIGGE